MDEVTKTIIETSVTILGMIAAFITAFLAEPVKNYFTNRAKSHHCFVSEPVRHSRAKN